MIQVQKIKEHKKIKNQLLKLIEKSKSENFDRFDKGVWEKITKTDFNFSTSPQEYKDLVISTIVPYTYNKRFCIQNVPDMWYQQYKKNDNHGWHIHSGCHFSHIYLLELPKKKYLTQFYIDKLVEVEAEEGDLISFPAYIIHRSPIIKDNTRKPVIVFNTSFDEPNDKLINIDK